MSWVLVEFHGIPHIVASTFGLPTPDEESWGEQEFLTKFQERVDSATTYTNVENALIYGQNSINVGYHVGVDYLGEPPNDIQGRQFYGYYTVTVEDWIYAGSMNPDPDDPWSTWVNGPAELAELNITDGNGNPWSTYYFGLPNPYYIPFDFGRPLFDTAANSVNFNTINFHDILSASDHYHASAGNDVVVLPNSVAVAAQWEYNDGIGIQDPGGYWVSQFFADAGNDTVTGGIFVDRIFGGSGNDTLMGNGSADYLYGDEGNDILRGGVGEDWLYGGTGNDTFVPGLDGDFLSDDAGVDTVDYSASAAAITVNMVTFVSLGGDAADDVFASTIENVIASSFSDSVTAGDGVNRLVGRGGNDTLNGGGGNDTLVGGAGADRLIGGAGRDVFDFDVAAESTPALRDVLRGGGGAAAFQSPGSALGDLIDLSTIDANTGVSGNQAFGFGTSTGAGRLWAVNVGTLTVLRGNVDADATVEFEMAIEDGTVIAGAYTAGDFVL